MIPTKIKFSPEGRLERIESTQLMLTYQLLVYLRENTRTSSSGQIGKPSENPKLPQLVAIGFQSQQKHCGCFRYLFKLFLLKLHLRSIWLLYSWTLAAHLTTYGGPLYLLVLGRKMSLQTYNLLMGSYLSQRNLFIEEGHKSKEKSIVDVKKRVCIRSDTLEPNIWCLAYLIPVLRASTIYL